MVSGRSWTSKAHCLTHAEAQLPNCVGNTYFEITSVLPFISGQFFESHPQIGVADKLYSLPVGFLLQEEGGSASGCDLDGSTPEGKAPMSYACVYPTLRSAAQARNGLGCELRRGHLAAMPGL